MVFRVAIKYLNGCPVEVTGKPLLGYSRAGESRGAGQGEVLFLLTTYLVQTEWDLEHINPQSQSQTGGCQRLGAWGETRNYSSLSTGFPFGR